VFVAAVEEGSLTAASKRLGLTTSYASRLVTRADDRAARRGREGEVGLLGPVSL
jgi:DNA-binding transcriptional LysR family regulator